MTEEEECAALEAEKKRRKEERERLAAEKKKKLEEQSNPFPAKPSLPPLDKSLTLVEQAQSLTQETLDAARLIMNDVSEPASARLQAAIFIKEIGHGKATADVPRMADKRNKDDVSAKVLALMTDAQLEELRSTGDA